MPWFWTKRRVNPERLAIHNDLVRKVWLASMQLDSTSQRTLEALYIYDEGRQAMSNRLGIEGYKVDRLIRRANRRLRDACRSAGILRRMR